MGKGYPEVLSSRAHFELQNCSPTAFKMDTGLHSLGWPGTCYIDQAWPPTPRHLPACLLNTVCHCAQPRLYFLKKTLKPGTVAQASDPSHWEAEIGGLPSVFQARMSPWNSECSPGWPQTHGSPHGTECWGYRQEPAHSPNSYFLG